MKEASELPRDPQPRDTGIHWSKDFVEHIRTVHFAIVALCTALIILSLIPARTHARKAIQQLGALETIRAWYSPQKVCESAHSVLSRTGLPVADQFPLTSEPIEGWPRAALSVSAHKETFSTVAVPYSICRVQKELRKPNLNTILGFRDFWTILPYAYKVKFPEKFSEFGYATDSRNTAIVSIRVRPTSWNREGITAKLADDRDVLVANLVDEDNDTVHIVIPVDSWRLDDVDADYLMSTLPPVEGRKVDREARFDTIFADLRSAATGMESLDLTSLGGELAQEAKKGSDPIEAFGIKLPAEQVSVWGVILVLAGQIYLYLHLRELGGRMRPTDPGWDVPWIGVYKSRMARVCLWITLVALPSLAVMTVTLRARAAAVADQSAHSGQVNDSFVIAATLAAAFIAIATWKIAPKSELTRPWDSRAEPEEGRANVLPSEKAASRPQDRLQPAATPEGSVVGPNSDKFQP